MARKPNISQFSEEVTQTISQIWRSSMVMLKNEADPFVKGTITFPQYLALDLLESRGSLKMKDVAKALHVSLPAATGLTNRMVKMNMIKRRFDPGDRRVIFIEVTKSGKRAVDSVKSARKKFIEKVFSELSDKERQTYLTLIRKVKRTLYEKIQK